MLPGLLEAFAAAPATMDAMNRFDDMVCRLPSGVNFYRLLEAKPELARILSLILVNAPVLSEQLARRPVLLDGLIDASSFAAPADAGTVARRLREGPAEEGFDARLDRVRRLVNEKRFALGVQLIARHRDPLDLALGYACLAEGTIVGLLFSVSARRAAPAIST